MGDDKVGFAVTGTAFPVKGLPVHAVEDRVAVVQFVPEGFVKKPFGVTLRFLV